MKVLQRIEKWMTRRKKKVKYSTLAHKDDLLNGLPTCLMPSAKQQHMSGMPSKHKVESRCTSTSGSLLELNQDVEKLDSTSLKELDDSAFVGNDELLYIPCKPALSMESLRYLDLHDTSFSSFMDSAELSLVDYSGEYDSRTSNSSFVDSSLIDYNAFVDIAKSKAIYDCLWNPVYHQTLRTIPPQPIAYMKLPDKCFRFNSPNGNSVVLQANSSARYDEKNVHKSDTSQTRLVDKHTKILAGNDEGKNEHADRHSYMTLECGPVLIFVPLPVVNYKKSNRLQQNIVVKIDSGVSTRNRGPHIKESYMTLMKGPILYYCPVSFQKLSRNPHTEQCLRTSFELNDNLGRVHKVKQTDICKRKAHNSSNVNLSKRDPYLMTSGKMENTLKKILLKFEKISPEKNEQTESIAREKDLFSLSSDFMGILTANPTLKMFSNKSRQLIRNILFYSCLVPSVQDAFCIYPLHKTLIRQNDSGFASEDPMCFEWQRLRSFHTYPISESGVSILHLAQEGFYFTGNGRDTKCFLCQCVYSGWSPDSDVRRTHLQLSPDCPIACQQESSNIPINPSRRRGHGQQQEISRFDENLAEDSGELPPVASHVEEALTSDQTANTSLLSSHEMSLSQCTARNHEVNVISESSQIQAPRGNTPVNMRRIEIPHNNSEVLSATHVPILNEETPQRLTPTEPRNSRSERSSSEILANRETQNSLTSSAQSVLTYKQKLSSHLDPLGIVWEKPKFSAYVILTTRVSSYEGWPENTTQTPIEMSKAGFFYAGHGDYVRCFFCGGGLRNWERDDVPWEEHARWFPRCAFVRNVQGQEYVDIIQRKNQPDNFDQICGITGVDLEKQVKIDLLKEEGYPQQRIQFAINVWEQRRDLAGYKLPMKAEDLVDIIEEDDKDHQNGSTSSSPSTDDHQNGPTSLSQGPTELETQQTEFSSLMSTLMCKVCFTQEVGMAFLPCGHLICCKECGPAVRKCLLCDVIIKGTVKTYFS